MRDTFTVSASLKFAAEDVPGPARTGRFMSTSVTLDTPVQSLPPDGFTTCKGQTDTVTIQLDLSDADHPTLIGVAFSGSEIITGAPLTVVAPGEELSPLDPLDCA